MNVLKNKKRWQNKKNVKKRKNVPCIKKTQKKRFYIYDANWATDEATHFGQLGDNIVRMLKM